ncbi:TPA: glycosyltransferase [Streptococcus suis]
MTVYTLRSWMTDKSFGYETTQVFRQNVLNDLGIANYLVLGSPYSTPFWKEQLQAQGYRLDNVIIIPHLYSDIDTCLRSYKISDFEEDLSKKQISWNEKKILSPTTAMYTTDEGYFDLNLTADGNILSIIERSLNLELKSVTSVFEKPFYTSFSDDSFCYYDKSGQIVLRGAIDNKDCYYFYQGQKWTMVDLFLAFLSNRLVYQKDVVLNDQFIDQTLEKFCQNQEIFYRYILHYNHYFSQKMVDGYNIKLGKEIFVASPYIIEPLAKDNIQAEFLPPIAVQVAQQTPKGLGSNKLLLVGNIYDHKRVAMAIEAMKEVPELELHIYGGRVEAIQALKEEHNVPDNVIFKGFVPSRQIPRSDYCAYLSCSLSEMFANAMVECLGQGLIPILSRVDYGHNQVLEELGIYQQCGFDSVEDLVEVLQNLVTLPFEERQQLSNKILHYSQKFSYAEAQKQYKLALGYN